MKAALGLLSLWFLARNHISSPVLELSALPVNVSEGVLLDRESTVNTIKYEFTFSSGIRLGKHSLMDHPSHRAPAALQKGRACQ